MGRLIRANVDQSHSIVQSRHSYGHGQDTVIPNTLKIEIVNISSLQTAHFANNVTDDVSIPNIDHAQHNISVLYIHFPIGVGDAYLTDMEWAQKMICKAPDQWRVEMVANPQQCEVYFKLYPLSNIELHPGEKIDISIMNIVSFGVLDKMVYVAVDFPSIQMVDKSLPESNEQRWGLSDEGTDYLPYFKKVEPLHIEQFECDRDKVAFGDKVVIKWRVYGEFKQCVFMPGDIKVDREGSLEVEVFEDTTFQLYAFDEQQQVSQTMTIYMEPAVIVSFDPPPFEQQDETKVAITLTYEVKNAQYVYLDQGIGRLEAKAGSVTVEPSKKQTVYTLSCMGPDGLVQKECIVESAYFEKKQ